MTNDGARGAVCSLASPDLLLTSPERNPVLSVRGLEVAFTGRRRPAPAVRKIDFDVFPGEVLAIVGESGSGKSVTALAITGLLGENARVRGHIRVDGLDVLTATREQLRHLRGNDVGMIFQDPSTTLNPVLPIGRQVIEGEVAFGRVPKNVAREAAAAALREVDIPDPAAQIDRFPHQFSGGMRQRAVIAMAMAGRKKLIIADEPTTALDVTVQAQVLDLLARRQRETGAAIILITHDLGVVAEVADRVLVMYGGRIVETGPVREIFRRPLHPYTIGLLRGLPRIDTVGDRLVPIPGQPPPPGRMPSGCAFHPRCAIGRDREICARDDPELAESAPERALACHFALEFSSVPRAVVAAAPKAETWPRPAPEPLLIVDDLRVHFPIRTKLLRRRVGTVRAVDGVSLVVKAGETVGLVGESGCGKTTTGRTIIGLVRPTSGKIVFAGQDITGMGRRDRTKISRDMHYVFQDPYASLNPVRTAAEIVAEPLRIHGLYDEMGGAAHVVDLFDRVGLSKTVLNRTPREFSGGQKQRIGIARALALRPRLLILDEPVASLDVSIQAQIVNLLGDLQRDLGLAYLFIAHDLSVVRHISDRVAVMYLGRIVEESVRDTLYATPLHPYTQSLLSAVPVPDPERRNARSRIVLQGDIPSPARPPSGCTFHPRCFRADFRCAIEAPRFVNYPGLPTNCACHHAGPLAEAAG